MQGTPVPDFAEPTYLVTAYRTVHPGFLAADWTYGAPQPRLTVYNIVAGLPMAVLPMEAVGWLGRLAIWTAILVAAFRIGRRLDLTPASVGVVLILWLALSQTAEAVGLGWPLRGLNPSAIAFALGFWALEGLLAGRLIRAGICLGLSVAVHQSAGLPFALGILGGMIALRIPLRAQAMLVAVSVVAALPGIVPTLGALEGQGSALRAEWEYTARQRLPMHLGLETFSRASLAAVAAAVAFAWAGLRSAGERPAARALSGFLAGPVAVFLFGVLATAIGRWEWLIVYPFRVLPTVAPLLALCAMAVAFRQGSLGSRPVFALGAALTLLLLPNPLSHIASRVGLNVAAWRAEPDDWSRAMGWLARETPDTAIVLMSPRDPRSAYASGRAQVVHWAFTRLDRLPEWRERLEALMGPLESTTQPEAAEARFSALSRDSLLHLRARYGGDFVVTRGRYDFPLAAEFGAYRIYRLPPSTAGEEALRRSSAARSRSSSSGESLTRSEIR